MVSRARTSILPGTGRGTSRRLVEGLALIDNVRHDSTDIVKNSARRNSQRSEPLRHQPLVARFVTGCVAAPIMRLAIHFDSNLGRETDEVEHIGSRWMLTSKLEAAGAPPKLPPEQNFGKRHLASQPACCADNRSRSRQHRASPSTMLGMVPLPVPGRMLHGAAS